MASFASKRVDDRVASIDNEKLQLNVRKLEDLYSTGRVTDDGEILAGLPAYALGIISGSCIRAALHGRKWLKEEILVTQKSCNPHQHRRCMLGCRMRDLSKSERVALIGPHSADDPRLASDEIVVEPLFARFGKICRVKLPGKSPCLAVELDPYYSGPTLKILEKIRRECPELVTDVELMAREQPTSGERVITNVDELEPATLDDTVLADACLPPHCGRRGVLASLRELRADTSRLGLSRNSTRVYPKGGMCSREVLINSSIHKEADVSASWPTCSLILIAALSAEERTELKLDLADVSAVVDASSSMRDKILSQVQSQVEAGSLPQEIKRWDHKLGKYVIVETAAAVKVLVLHTVSNPYARAGLSPADVKKLCNELPLLASYRRVWKKAAEFVSYKLLRRLASVGYHIPRGAKKSTYIHLALTYVESGFMTALMRAIAEYLAERSIEVLPGDFTYRYDALAISDRMIELLSADPDWVNEVNAMSGNYFDVALKQIKPKRQDVPDTVQELRRAA